MTSPRGALRAWGPALGWALAIFVFSSFPGSAYPATGLVHADKLVHVAIFGLLGALCARALVRTTGWGTATLLAVAALLAALYGASDELHQRFVPGRNADWRDLVADAAGAVLGAALMVVIASRRRHRASGAVR